MSNALCQHICPRFTGNGFASASLALADDLVMFCGSRLEFNSGMHGSPFYCETGSIPISTVILVQEKSIPIATSSQKSDAPRLPGGAFNRTHTCYTVTDRKIIKYYNIFHLNYPPACYCRPAAGKASFHFFTQPNAIVSQQ